MRAKRPMNAILPSSRATRRGQNAWVMISSLLWCVLASASSAHEDPAPQFHERVLVGTQMTCGTVRKDWILEVDGGGLVLGDFDGSGSVDLVLVDGSTPERALAGGPGQPARLFWNSGSASFAPADETWSLVPGRWGMGGAAGDLDGDGRTDLVVTHWGADQRFRNTGHGFELVAESGLTGQRWGTSAALLDYDRDGVLDLFVVNYLDFDFADVASRASGECVWKGVAVNCGPEGLAPQGDQLYHGRSEGGFEEVTEALGIGAAPAAFGLGVVSGDFDADGDQDLYVTNDSMPNHLWQNDTTPGGTLFQEVGLRRGVAVSANGREEAGMGVAEGDLDGDGRTDFVVTNFSGESHSVYLSGGRRSYRERGGQLGVGGDSVPLLGWGTGLHDFDLDGDLDLFACHGHVYPQADRPGSDSSYAQHDLLWRNGGDGDTPAFQVEPLSDGPARVSRAAVAADLDRDGDLDLLVIELDGPVHLFENTQAVGESHWLGVGLVDRTSPGADEPVRFRAVVGARVEVDLGERTLTRELGSSAGFQANGPAELHFGLGNAEELAGLRVVWPDGVREAFTPPPTNAWVVVARGAGRVL